jgi:hypothetical protein
VIETGAEFQIGLTGDVPLIVGYTKGLRLKHGKATRVTQIRALALWVL